MRTAASFTDSEAGDAASAAASNVDDLGGTLMDENISRAAGAEHGTMATAEDFRAMLEPLGRTLVQRNTLYGRVDAGGTLAADPD